MDGDTGPLPPLPPTALITRYSAHLGLHGHGADGGPQLEVRPEEARAAAQLLLAGGRQAAQRGELAGA